MRVRYEHVSRKLKTRDLDRRRSVVGARGWVGDHHVYH